MRVSDPAPPPEGSPPKYMDPVMAGKAAAEPCAKCHGDNGISHKEGVPSLVGISPKYLVETIKAYKEGDRPLDDKNADMKKALEALTDEDIQHIALYYGVQTDNLTRAPDAKPAVAPIGKDALAVLRQVSRRNRRFDQRRDAKSGGSGCGVSARAPCGPTRTRPATTTRWDRRRRSSTTSK